MFVQKASLVPPPPSRLPPPSSLLHLPPPSSVLPPPSVKVQTPLARLRHCCATAGPVQGQLVGTGVDNKTVGQHR